MIEPSSRSSCEKEKIQYIKPARVFDTMGHKYKGDLILTLKVKNSQSWEGIRQRYIGLH